MLKLFKKKDKTLEYAIRFIKQQKNLNKRNIKLLKNLEYDTSEIDDWDSIYSYILKKLKSLK